MVVILMLALKIYYMIGSNKNHSKLGLTLVELLVAATVFSLVVVTVVGLFTTAIRSQRKSMVIQNVQDNGRYLIGFMAKEIRMSELNASDGETTTLNIIHPTSGSVIYVFTGTQILRNGEPINSDEVNVQGKFYIDGKTSGDDEQPRVTLIMKVETTGEKAEERTEINLQTTLSQRKLD